VAVTEASEIVVAGEVDGRLVAVDPGGRYVAVEHDATVTVYDADDALAPVMLCPAPKSFAAIAVQPGGRGVAVSDVDGLRLRRADGVVLRATTDLDPGELRFTADGARLLSVSAPCRLDMFATDTMALLDTVEVAVGAAPVEGIELAVAPAARSAVAFFSNLGDDLLVLGSVDMSTDELRLFMPEPAGDLLPGERVTGVAVTSAGELLVLDSDGWLSRLTPPGTGTERYSLRQTVLGDSDGVPQLEIDGPLSVRSDRVAAVVSAEHRIAKGWTTQAVALALVEPRTGTVLGRLELPWADREELVFVEAGVVWQHVEGRARIARWV
jgi:hypothetical protein